MQGHIPQIIAHLPEQGCFDEHGLTDYGLHAYRIGAVIAADGLAVGPS